MRQWHHGLLLAPLFGLATTVSCSDKELDASEEKDVGAQCEPGDAEACNEGLACEPVSGSDDSVCAARVEIRGQVIDALDDEPVEGAHVVASDELGAPVTGVAITDADGRYTLGVSVRRDESGEIAEAQRWTLVVSADDYLAFPSAVRPALPIDAQDLSDDPEGEDTILGTIDNASTVVALIPRPDEEHDYATVSGHVEGENAAGTLVIAEGPTPPAVAIADADGDFTLFNVPPGAATVRGYVQGQEVEPASIDVGDDDITDVTLSLSTDDPDSMATVSGSVNIVNAPGGSATSVVLVPSSVFHETFERGPVPAGLRAPAPPEAVSVTSGFDIAGVPAGRYFVLAAFENDALVRDPDESIAGTQIPEIEVRPGEDLDVAESFKITEALATIFPGADGPQAVDAAPTFVWADDSSEDRYEIVVFDAFGNEVWRDDQIPGVSGSDTAEVAYGGPELEVGMYYQFRVTSWRDTPQGSNAISRTEDLHGVFVLE